MSISCDFKTYNEDTQIWRYMSIYKLFDLLNNKRVFFTRSDKFEDKLEGSFPFNYEDNLKRIYPEMNDEQIARFRYLSKKEREYYYINCWTAQRSESVALWKLYANKDLVIKSSIGSLKSSLLNHSSVIIHFDEVLYEDYASCKYDPRYMQERFRRKDESFYYESEMRLIICKQKYSEEKDIMNDPDHVIQDHYCIDIDPDLLIENILISPFATDFEEDQIKQLIKNFDLLHGTEYINRIISSKLKRTAYF